MLEQGDISPQTESSVAMRKSRNLEPMDGSRAIPLASVLGRGRSAPATQPLLPPPPVPAKVAVNRPQQLLELAGKVSRAAWGGIGLLAEGELVDHFTFGISDEKATELARTSWFVPLLRFIQKHPGRTSLDDLRKAPLQQEAAGEATPSAADCPFPPDANLPTLGSFLGIALDCPGLYQGALYLTRSPEQPPFDADDEVTVTALCGWLEQARFFDEMHLLTRLRLLNQVAEAAAGSLDLDRILAVALRELDRHLPFQMGAVWLVEEGDGVDGSSNPQQAAEAPPQRGDSDPVKPVDPSVQLPREAIRNSGIKRRKAAMTDKSVDVSTSALVLTAASTFSEQQSEVLGLDVAMRLRIAETPFAVCLSDGQAVYGDLRRPVERNSWLADNLAKGGAMAYFAVPLRAGDRTVGILQSVCMRPSGFTNEQIQLLYLVADLLGPAISNCRLFTRLSTAYEELRRTQHHLIQTEKMRALGELAAGMAHDFNNSLCAVIGFLELTLRDKALPGVYRSYLESSLTCALDAAHTVRRVQDFARWQRREASAELIDPNELVHQTVELTRHKWDCPALTRKSSIGVEAFTEATARINGNRSELREVLTNLIFNAVDAMPQGGAIAVRTWSTSQDVFFSVQDTGMGISEAVRRRLFEPFFTTKGERGNGMGLSVTFGIVKRHNGEITVESEINRGATFTIRLPAAGEEGPTKTPAAAEEKASTAAKSLRILIVEDEEHIRRFLSAGLSQLGHQPRVTANAQEALEAFAEEPFDVVITDLGLPGVNGEEVARQVAERSPNVPVVLLTGWADQLRASTEPVAGVKFILGKPITLNSLADTLTMLCHPA